VLLGVLCEIKSPIGKSRKHTIKDQFDRATNQQASVLVLDGRRTKLDDEHILTKIRHELSHRRRIKRVVFITKAEEIIDIPR
jgi:hypothetical protein